MTAPAPVLFSPRGAVFAAFASGGLLSFCVRPGRSGAAVVLVASFSSPASAGRFARRAARRAGRSVVVRSVCPGVWAVSCPVAWPSSRLPAGAGRAWPVSGGLRGLAAALGWAGLPRPLSS